MFVKSIDKCIDDCYQELLASKNKKVSKVVQSFLKEAPEQLQEEMLKTIIRDMIGIILASGVEEEEYEDIILHMLPQAIKMLPAMKQICKLKITLDGYENEIYRIIHIPYYMRLADLGYVILSIFDTMAYHLFDFTIKKQRYHCEVKRIMGEYFEDDKFALDYELAGFNFKKNSKFSFCYDYGENYEFTIQVLDIIKTDDLVDIEDIEVIDGKGNGIWEDAHYLMDLYYSDKKAFQAYMKENGLEEEDFPIHEEFDIDTCNGVLYDEFFDIKMGYENPPEDDFC